MKIYQYGITSKSIYFVILMTPLISWTSYLPNIQDNWNTFGFLSRIIVSIIIGSVLLIFIGQRKKIYFMPKAIEVVDFFTKTHQYDWSQIKDIKIDHKYLIKRLNIYFYDKYELLFEINDKIINKIISVCPLDEIKNKFLKNIST